MKGSRALCIKAPGKWLMASDFPLTPLKSDSGHLLASGAHLCSGAEVGPTLPLPNGMYDGVVATDMGNCLLALPSPALSAWVLCIPLCTAETRVAPVSRMQHLTNEDWNSCFHLRVHFLNAWRREECGFWRTSNEVCYNSEKEACSHHL